ncbi:hypothetical protein [Streptomyces sp. NPDC059593]|uniref:hypothetical protein n=1 Tax=Streptomyces sp. NPDC059593 TaxID=3346878 RepID=UPI0036D07BBD
MSNSAGIQVGMPDVVAASSFPQYAYGTLLAAFLARRLGLGEVSVAELGVAGGNGLVELERVAAEIGAEQGVKVGTYGFDLGSGMPTPVDHRDNPSMWQHGFFKMDEELIRSHLTSAELVLGDIADTGPRFMRSGVAPIGFLSFDLDYYSSTVVAMKALLEESPEHYLPRIVCYFDDTVGPHEELHSEFTGELLAIKEFNAAHEHRKIGRINGLRYKLLPMTESNDEFSWIEGMYVLHLFDHPLYNQYVYPDADRQFPLGG